MPLVSAVVITKNEERKIARCLEALRWADEIVIVDNESTDATREIARSYTDKIFVRKMEDFSSQKNFAVSKTSGEWILSVDADETVSPELRDSLLAAVRNPTPYDAFTVRRRNYVFGKNLRFGGQGIERLIRLFRSGRALFEQPVHEKLIVRGPVGELSGELRHDSLASLREYREKLERYTDFEARWLFRRRVRSSWGRRWIAPVLRFIYFYFFRLGFLDGSTGFRYHFLSSVYYHLKYSKLRRLERSGG